MNSFISNGPRGDGPQVLISNGNFLDNVVFGNYWSDYKGNDSNQDGIGDTPYTAIGNVNNSKPLMIQPVIFIMNQL